MKEYFKQHPAAMILAIIFTFGIIALIGYYFWGWFKTDKDKWIDDCVKKMQKNGVMLPNYKEACERQWDNKHQEGFPKDAKDGDKFTKDGKVYVFKKMEINCITTPCPDGMWVLFNEGDTPEGHRMFADGGILGLDLSGTPTSSSQQKGTKKLCWSKDWKDSKNRDYHFQIFAVGCNDKAVTDLISVIENKGFQSLNNPNILQKDISTVIQQLNYELKYYYYKANIEAKVWSNYVGTTVSHQSQEHSQQGNIPQGGGITPPANYMECDKGYVYTDQKSKIRFYYTVSIPVPSSCDQVKVKKAMDLISSNLQSKEGTWKWNEIGQQLLPVQKLIDINYAPLKLKMNWMKI